VEVGPDGLGCDGRGRAVGTDGAVDEAAGLGEIDWDAATRIFRWNEGIGESFHCIIVPWHTSHSAEPLSRAAVTPLNS
jgi:hypothetical protein